MSYPAVDFLPMTLSTAELSYDLIRRINVKKHGRMLATNSSYKLAAANAEATQSDQEVSYMCCFGGKQDSLLIWYKHICKVLTTNLLVILLP